uniref:Uncharacterized protein n=2 Tax=Arion vulgaris TaxID=1028688 RepID=A0A0B7A570_9EUPU
MNRLLIIRASVETSGTYVCLALRNGEILQQKSLNVVVLGNSESSNYVRPIDSGPRRGDMVPGREIEYRPVRSVDRVRFESNWNPSSIVSNRMWNSFLDKTSDKVESVQNVREDDAKDVVAKLSSTQISNFDQILSRYKEAHERIDDNTDALTNTNSENVLAVNKNTVKNQERMPKKKSTLVVDELKRDFLKNSNTLEAKLAIIATNDKNVYVHNEIPDAVLQIFRRSDHSRMKRQIEESTTEVSTTENIDPTDSTIDTITSVIDINTTEEEDSKTSFEQTDYDLSTVSGDEDISITTPIPTDPSETKTQKNDNGDDNNDKSANKGLPCPTKQEETSNFGKYGVLAFAISLAIAVLLLYTILMIIFMPRIMAKKRSKLEIEGSVYRKTGPGGREEAPLVVLDILNEPEASTDQEKQTKVDLDSSITLSTNSNADKKDEDSNEASASVSTFLLRQESTKNSDEDSKADGNDKKGETKSENGEPKTSQSVPAGTQDSNVAGSPKTQTELETATKSKDSPPESASQNNSIFNRLDENSDPDKTPSDSVIPGNGPTVLATNEPPVVLV